jgi:hypothetical protein
MASFELISCDDAYALGIRWVDKIALLFVITNRAFWLPQFHFGRWSNGTTLMVTFLYVQVQLDVAHQRP